MKKKLLVILIAILCLGSPVYAAEDYTDGDTEQVYTWVQEGDARFCYINNDGWSEADMLKGFHTIDGELYYFCEEPINGFQYGQMYTGELWYGDFTFTFDSEGHMTGIYGGLE